MIYSKIIKIAPVCSLAIPRKRVGAVGESFPVWNRPSRKRGGPLQGYHGIPAVMSIPPVRQAGIKPLPGHGLIKKVIGSGGVFLLPCIGEFRQ